ncbi:uncharacterized protein YALI1_F10270g [Yarrowia lipolytica]|uniref:Uncharacterized protein n=1 Tax=Yarrowia lipolytica TaxID=4952 RepID=A0A1D8NMD8_YARLL|nr:hypothetical protein YALI1_F10270g [Yarrowia lipolytica]
MGIRSYSSERRTTHNSHLRSKTLSIDSLCSIRRTWVGQSPPFCQLQCPTMPLLHITILTCPNLSVTAGIH